MQRSSPSFSIIVNTLNRASELNKTLASLAWLHYDGDFEVIVVNGPSTDDTLGVVRRASGRVRLEQCPVPNLSVSRNIGIRAARGEIVAFLDDDAVPEPEWLTELANGYDSDDVGATGGLVYDHTGYTLQYCYSTANRLGNADWSGHGATEHLCFPGSYRFPYLQGTNASFRRAALLEVGGFDEEFEYYLDETDVCCRLVDRGYIVRQLPNAYVHHRFAPSHIRNVHRIARQRFPIVKNKIYFSLRHARDFHSLPEILDDGCRFIEGHRRDVQQQMVDSRLGEADREGFEADAERAIEVALVRGLASPAQGVDIGEAGGELLSFGRLIAPEPRKVVVLVSKDFPPNHSGGVATFMRDLATGIAARGHTVHVVTASRDVNRVDFEEGVWIHRIVATPQAPSSQDVGSIPVPIWNWSATALEETRRIATHRRIDVVEAPIWDCEGIAFALAAEWPLVTNLQTTLSFWLDSHPECRNDAVWMDSFGSPMMRIERTVMERSTSIRAISRAIAADIEDRYGMTFDRGRLHVIPLGLRAVTAGQAAAHPPGIEILFVGRLEKRKGIDVLLSAVPIVCQVEPAVRFRVVGDRTLPGERGRTYEEEFRASGLPPSILERVTFVGYANDAALLDEYARCDMFVGPSRYESFGLVFVEAMRFGKPVVGCLAGGMPEVIDDGVTGVLVEPGDPDALAAAILRLVRNPALREELGRNGRAVFDARFTAARMAEESLRLYEATTPAFDVTR